MFYNGAGWDQAWLDKIFPRTPLYLHAPDLVVRNLAELVDTARRAVAEPPAETLG